MSSSTGETIAWLRRARSLPLARFMGIGVLSTLAYALLFLILVGPLGSASANLCALVITAVANTAANRRLTFGVRGRAGLLRHHLGGLVMFAISLAMTDLSLALLHALDPHPARQLELAVLLAASLTATATRYVGFSAWLFRSPSPGRLTHPVHPLPTRGS